MESYVTRMKKRQSELEQAVKKCRKILATPVDGRLDIELRDGSYCYYEIARNSVDLAKKRKYLSKKKLDRAADIATRDYAKKLEMMATKELKILDRAIEFYEGDTAYECYDNLHVARQKLVEPILVSNEMFADQWNNAEKAKATNTYPVNGEIVTDNGEYVRSKSEKIIADTLNKFNVPYKYEEALMFGDHPVFPDFTVLKKSERKVIYWEHMGMLDNEDYCESVQNKINRYNRNGIIIGDNLILTFETKDSPLSSRVIESIVKTMIV